MKTNYSQSTKLIVGLFIFMMIGFYYNNKAYAISHDCGAEVSSTSADKFKNVFPPEAIARASLGLAAYCCHQIGYNKKASICIDKTTQKEKDWPLDYPASPFLFDHLMDIGLRMLDAFGLPDGVPADPTGQAWRDEIDKIAGAEKGTLPDKTSKLYKKYWTLKPENYLGIKNLKIENFKEKENSTLDNYLTNYNNLDLVTLADKYNNLCMIAWNMYQKSSGIGKIIIGDNRPSLSRSHYNDCKDLVKSRTDKEYTNTKTVLMESSNQIVSDNVKKVFIADFVQDKLMSLKDIIIEIKNIFITVVKQAAVCKQCTQ